jgi:hypothetical protein
MVKKLRGAGDVQIVQQPEAANGYSLVIEFDDLGEGGVPDLSGSGFYSIQLRQRGR